MTKVWQRFCCAISTRTASNLPILLIIHTIRTPIQSAISNRIHRARGIHVRSLKKIYVIYRQYRRPDQPYFHPPNRRRFLSLRCQRSHGKGATLVGYRASNIAWIVVFFLARLTYSITIFTVIQSRSKHLCIVSIMHCDLFDEDLPDLFAGSLPLNINNM